jgi:hypothetical protein
LNLSKQNQIPEEENEESISDGENCSNLGGSDSDPSEDNMDPVEFIHIMQSVFKDDN